LFTEGIGFYSLHDLIRLGVLDQSKIKEPEFYVAKELWPNLKQELNQGKSLDEAIDSIEREK